MAQILQPVVQPSEDKTKLSFNTELVLSLSICRLLNSINLKQELLNFLDKVSIFLFLQLVLPHYPVSFFIHPVSIVAGKNRFDRDKLPRQEEFAKALYTFDIGQNDLSVGFRKMSSDQLKATIPDIVSHLASAIRVRLHYPITVSQVCH